MFPLIDRNDVVFYVAADGYPDHWSEESCNRFKKLQQLWNACGPFKLVCSGGLPNRFKRTIADSIADMIDWRIRKGNDQIIDEMDKTSRDTAEQVINVAKIYHDYCNAHGYEGRNCPKLIAISNWWHLLRIGQMFKRKGIKITRIASPTAGPLLFRFKNALKEFSIWMISFIDPEFKMIGYWEKIRIDRANQAFQL